MQKLRKERERERVREIEKKRTTKLPPIQLNDVDN